MIKFGHLFLLVPLALAGCASDPDSPPSSSDQVEALKERVRELYRQARESGQQVPQDALEWARQDVRRIGDWEYKIEELPREDPQARQARLNELGAERWEVFWIEPVGDERPCLPEAPVQELAGEDPPFPIAAPLAIRWRGCGIVEAGSAEEGFPGTGKSAGVAPGRRRRAENSGGMTSVFKEMLQ